MRFLTCLLALAAVLLPMRALAFDAARAPGYGSPDMYRPNVDRLIVHSPGSTGPVDDMNVTLPDSGAIARSLRNRWLDEVDVTDFGAKCDGGSDDTAAINKGISALKHRVRGGILNFPPRACIVSGLLEVQASNVEFAGKGRLATAIIANFPAGDVVRFGSNAPGTQYSNFTIRDMTLAASVPRTSGAWINDYNGVNLLVRNVKLQGGVDGILVDNKSGSLGQTAARIENVIAENMTGECYSFGKYSTSPALFANEIYVLNSVAAHCGTGLAIYSLSGGYIEGLSIYKSTNNGIVVQPTSAHLGVQGVWFNKTLADSSAANGWYVGGTGKIAEVKITASQASSSGAHGLTIEPGTKLDSLLLTDFQSTFNGHHGARIGGGTNVTVRGGEFYYNGNGAGGVGVAVENNVKGFSITGINSGLGGWAKLNITDLIKQGKPMKQTHCVYLAGPANNNYIVRDNMCMGNTSGGSQIFDGGMGTNKSVGGNIAY